MKIQKEFLQVSKVAHMLDCSHDYVHALIRDGKLQAIGLGQRATRVSRDSLMRLIEVSKIDPNAYYE